MASFVVGACVLVTFFIVFYGYSLRAVYQNKDSAMRELIVRINAERF